MGPIQPGRTGLVACAAWARATGERGEQRVLGEGAGQGARASVQGTWPYDLGELTVRLGRARDAAGAAWARLGTVGTASTRLEQLETDVASI